MLNIGLFILSHLSIFWLAASAVAVALLGYFNLAFLKKELLPICAIIAVGLIASQLYSDQKVIADLRDKAKTADLQAAQMRMDIDEYTSAIGDLQRNQQAIRKQIAAARSGLDSKTILKESSDDPAKADSDLTDRWNTLDGMFDDATGGTQQTSASSASADPNKGG